MMLATCPALGLVGRPPACVPRRVAGVPDAGRSASRRPFLRSASASSARGGSPAPLARAAAPSVAPRTPLGSGQPFDLLQGFQGEEQRLFPSGSRDGDPFGPSGGNEGATGEPKGENEGRAEGEAGPSGRDTGPAPPPAPPIQAQSTSLSTPAAPVAPALELFPPPHFGPGETAPAPPSAPLAREGGSAAAPGAAPSSGPREEEPSDVLIEFVNVHKWFGTKHVLAGASFKIRRGEAVGIIGASGTGKSTTLRIAAGILEPDLGEVRIRGVPRRGLLSDHWGAADRGARPPRGLTRGLGALARKAGSWLGLTGAGKLGEAPGGAYETSGPARGEAAAGPSPPPTEADLKIGLVFQSGALFDSLTVGENVGFLLYEHSELPEAEIEALVLAALTKVGLPNAAGLMPSQLSGGMRKRVALARAIVRDLRHLGEEQVIMYDEPTAGLDPVASTVVEDLIRSLHVRDDARAQGGEGEGEGADAASGHPGCEGAPREGSADLGPGSWGAAEGSAEAPGARAPSSPPLPTLGGIQSYLVVTHQQSTIRRAVDRLIFLHEGKVVWEGLVSELDACEVPVVKQFATGSLDGPITYV